ncbi:effector-associated constant component EACC1 [Nocardia rhamnosiphila]|uniref:effector-associated constant component EACC1 n=1 Tax=Nocardia rhamnosiphila TaxID=426716 RepID=UPI00068BBC32|nr:hypothetical protein [Nocardia rhamnosiphila]
MTDDHEDIRIRVIAGDTFRSERLTRDLHRTLSTVEDLEVDFAGTDRAGQADGEKGAGVADLALSASVAVPVATAVTRVLVTAIREWCARERNRKVEIARDEGGSIVITGGIDERTERIVRLLAGERHDPATESDRELP